MKTLQKIGGAGAFLLGASFLLLIISNVIIKPGLGINGGADEANPAKLLPVVSALRFWYAIPILFAIGFLLISLSLNERLENSASALMRIATASGLVAAVLFLAEGMYSFGILPVAGSIYSQNPSSFTVADLALAGGVADGLTTAAIFASGWFVLLTSWAGLRGGLPSLLNYLGLLFGLTGILAFIVPPLSIIGAVLGVVWSLWLGVALLRDPARLVATGTSHA